MAAAAHERLELPFGFALRTPQAPGHPDLNALHVRRAAGELTPAEVGALAARLGAPVISIRDPATAGRLGPALEGAGWRGNRLLFMAHDGRAVTGAREVQEIDPGEIAPLRREWIASTVEPVDERMLAAVAVADRRLIRSSPTMAFGIRSSGRLVSMALLIGNGPDLMVQDVYTTPSQRGRGLAAAVVSSAVAAAQAAGPQLVWLCTDADGRAQRLYERLGFEPVGVVQRFFAARRG